MLFVQHFSRTTTIWQKREQRSRAPIWNRFCPWPEPPGHALLDRFDRLAARRNVRLVLGVLGVESGLLLLALRGRIRDGRLGILAVLLVLDLRRLIIKLQLKGGWSFFRKPNYLPLFPPNVSQDIFCERCCD